MDTIWKQAKRWLPGLLISVVALFILFRAIDFDDVVTAMQLIKVNFLIIAVVLTILSLFFKALTWRSILNLDVDLVETFFIICQGYLLNNVLPLKMGEIGRAVLMNHKTGKGVMYMFSSIVIERAIDVGFAAGLVLSTLPLTTQVESAKSIASVALLAVLVGFVALFFISRFHETIAGWMTKLFQRWAWGQEAILPRLISFLDGFQVITNPMQFVKAIFWSALTWLTWVVIYYFGLRSIAPDAPFWWGAFINGLLALGAAVPSAPAGLGVYEASTVGALAILNVAPSLSLAYAIVMHFIQIIMTGIFGVIGFMRNKVSIGDLLRYEAQPESKQT